MASAADQPAPLMLSVSGCRGIVGASLTPEVIARYTAALASWVRDDSRSPTPRVVLGCDGRRGGDTLRTLAGATLAACGCEVLDIGVAATPTVGLMVTQLGAHAGVTLTASHNPGEWNGVKAIDATGAAPDAARAADIVERFRAARSAATTPERFGSVTPSPGAASAHVERTLSAIDAVHPVVRIRAARLKVVVDSVNASGAEAAAMLLDALGCETVHLNRDSSGVFPHAPEPTEENLCGLGEEVRRHSARVGFAQDPDADRLALIDEQGRYIGEEYTLVLAAIALLGSMGDRARGVTLAANLSTSRMIDDAAAAFGARVVRSAVGEANVVAAMRREGSIRGGSLLGGEGNGGVIWPAVCWIRDSIGSMALILALMARENAPLSALASRLPAYAIEKRKAPVREGLAERAVEAVRAAYTARPGARVDTQDGCRADFPVEGGHAWLHVRASNTEPIVRFIAEAPTRAQAASILDEAQRLIERP